MANFHELFEKLRVSVINFNSVFYDGKIVSSKISREQWNILNEQIKLLNQIFSFIKTEGDFKEFCDTIISAFIEIYKILILDEENYKAQLKVIFGWRRFLEEMCCINSNLVSIKKLKDFEKCSFVHLF